MNLLLRRAEVEGGVRDVRIADGRIAAIGTGLPRRPGESLLDAAGGALLPGLTDHHLHLFATAADLLSVPCGPPTVTDRAGLAAALHRAAPDRHGWIRGVRYHESVAGLLDAAAVDALRADVPVRIQHRSGALWMVNSLAAEAVGLAGGEHPGIECDALGLPTGRLWRADAWLGARLPRTGPPSLGALGERLAGYGITTVTDATPCLTPDTSTALVSAVAEGVLPQRVHLLGTGSPAPDGVAPGPWKIVLADSGLPDFDELTSEIDAAHRTGRPVAVHCVTREALLLLLAALDTAGTLPGDRVEHASLVPAEVLGRMHTMGLRVVTQPGFLADRGDDYLADLPTEDHGDLYRCASLRAAGIPLGLSSDAPYGPLDPWAVMRAAIERRTAKGRTVTPAERLTPAEALAGYLSPAERPGDAPVPLRAGVRADLLLLRVPRAQALQFPDAELVRLVVIDGRVVADRP